MTENSSVTVKPHSQSCMVFLTGDNGGADAFFHPDAKVIKNVEWPWDRSHLLHLYIIKF